MNYRKKYHFGDNMNVEELLNKCEGAYYNEDDFEKTIELCDEILKKDLNNQIALGFKASSQYLLGRCDEALNLLNKCIILYPNNYHYFNIKSEVMMAKEEYGEALECFQEIFRIGVSDEIEMGFIRLHYRTCMDLRIDQLIEREKYVDAWKCYNQLLDAKSDNPQRLDAIGRFKKHVRRITGKLKCRKYLVRISSDEAGSQLIEFLNENGFKGDMDFGLLISIDVVDKTYSPVSIERIGDNDIISESKFYDKVNHYPREKIVCKEIFGEDGRLVYEGYTLDNAPYGFGKAYFANGNLYREGIFDRKGIVQGKEYYPSGRLRFEGQWCLTGGYGPNAPCNGNAYGEDGELIYSGKFEIKRGGVGWPMIQKPKGFPLEQKNRPKIDYY